MKHTRMATRLVSGLLGAALAIAGATGPAIAKAPAANGRIAFDRNEGEAVFTVNPDGTGEQQLLPWSTCCPRWSPDGTRLSIPRLSDDGRILGAVVNADGSGYTPVPLDDPTLNGGGGVWSPDGSRGAGEYWDDSDASRNGIYTARIPGGSDLTRVTSNPYGEHDIPGDYSPDGRQIVFVRWNGTRRSGNTAVFVVNADGTGLRQLTAWGMAGCCAASWSPNGRWILFDARGNLYVVHPDGSGLRQIVLHPGSRHWAFEPAWSPDGTRIVFSMYVLALGQDDIYTALADGTDLVQVTNTPEHEGQADWGAATD